jgi:hypothetical protein
MDQSLSGLFGYLIFRLGAQNITTNTLGHPGFIQETIALGFFQRARDGFFGERLELEHDSAPDFYEDRIAFTQTRCCFSASAPPQKQAWEKK